MKDGAPFGLAGIWEDWKEPASGEWVRTFAIITTDANDLVADIHDRMPVVLAPADYERWLGEEPDPRDLMRPYPPELMRIWPISTRANKPENDDAGDRAARRAGGERINARLMDASTHVAMSRPCRVDWPRFIISAWNSVETFGNTRDMEMCWSVAVSWGFS